MLHRGAGAQVEFAQAGFAGWQQLHRPVPARRARHQEIAFAVDRSETRLLDLEQGVGQFGHAARVAEVGLQHRQRLSPRLGGWLRGRLTVACCVARQALPEQRTHRRPGEKIRVHDLVRIAAQQELPGLPEAGQHQGELHVGQVLHFVHHDKVVLRLCQRSPFIGHQIQIELAALCQPKPVAGKNGVRSFARGTSQQRLARAQRQVIRQGQRSFHLGADDAAELFEQGMCVQSAERVANTLAMALEPGPKCRECDLAPGRHAQGLDELAVAQEAGLLCRVLITVGVVHGAGRLGQIGRLRDIEDTALGVAHLGQRDGRLAGAR